MYWNTSAPSFLSRMKSEYDKFWASNQRLKKAASLALTPQEVYTLASIVEKETQYLRRNLAKGIYTFSVLNNKEVVESGKLVFE